MFHNLLFTDINLSNSTIFFEVSTIIT